MSEMATSVAMATYNGERYLQEQLDSLARQTLLPCELVACDDGSTDGTLDILHGFSAKAPFPVRIFQNKERLGHGRNFLRAATLCSGELIAFSDQDDVWLVGKLERCAAAVSETQSVLAIHSACVVSDDLRPIGHRTPSARRMTHIDAAAGWGWRPLVPRISMCPGFACVFRSSLLRQIPPKPPLCGLRTGHEHWLFFAAEAAGTIVLIPDILALYRQHETNTAGFRTSAWQGPKLKTVVAVGEAEYSRQAATALQCAKLLAEAAESLPELSSRLLRANCWYKRRANSLAQRAALYACRGSSHWMALRVCSLVFGGTYLPIPLGGLGLRSLAKDLVMTLFRGSEHGLPRAKGDRISNAGSISD